MASIQKVVNKKGVSYRVYIRRKGLPSINKTFYHKKEARDFVLKIEGDRQLQLAFGGKSSKTTFDELSVDYLLKWFKGKSLVDQKSRLNYWNQLLGLLDTVLH